MIATRNGVRCGLPSAPVTAMSLLTMVHGLKIGWPSRVGGFSRAYSAAIAFSPETQA